MTTLDLAFRIDQLRGKMYVNSVEAPIATGLASNINFVSYAGGQGKIIYNDRVALPELFTDPSPYQVQINSWLQVMSLLQASPISVTQAQAVKNALINAIYAVKRQAPVTVTAGGGSHQWDASDMAMARLSAMAGHVTVDQVNATIGGVNTSIGTINTSIGTANSNFTLADTNLLALISFLNGTLTNINSQMSALVGQANADLAIVNNLLSNLTSFRSLLNSAEAGVTGWADPGALHSQPNVTAIAFPALSGVGNGTGPTSVATTSTVTTLAAPTLQLLPVGATALVSLTPTDLKNIVAAIATQNANESLANAQKQAAVNALTHFADIIAYDATTGW